MKLKRWLKLKLSIALFALAASLPATNAVAQTSGECAAEETPKEILDCLEQEIVDARNYRLGFPLEKNRKNLRDSWRDDDLFEVFVELRQEAQALLLNTPEAFTDEDRERTLRLMRECVNETLAGQLQVGNENLLNAGRRKFPSVVTPQMVNMTRAPYNESDDWKELAICALDFEAGILEAIDVIRDIPDESVPEGAGNVLRSRGGVETRNTSAEGFANYTIIGEFDEPGVTSNSQGPFEAQFNNFVRTELNLLGALLYRRGTAASAMVDRIRRLAYTANNNVEGTQRHGEAGASAKEEYDRLAIQRAKRDAQLMFYSGLILRSELPKTFNGVERDDFKLHDGDRLFTAMNNLNVLFKDIRDGRPPTGLADQFVPSPNKRVGGVSGYLSDAITSVSRAKESQQIAETRIKEVEQAEVSEVELNRSLRENYITQIGQITGFEVDGEAQLLVDPLDQNNTFDLSILEKRDEFKDLVELRVAEAQGQVFNDNQGESLSDKLGTLGSIILRQNQAKLNSDISRDRLQKIPAAIERVEEKASAANALTESFTIRENELNKKYRAIEATFEGAIIAAEAVVTAELVTTDKRAAIYTGAAFEAAATVGSIIISGKERRAQNLIENDSTTAFRNLDAEFQIRELSEQINSARLDSELQRNNVAIQANELALSLRQLYDLIDNFGIYREETADLWFLDPTLERESLDAELQADADLADCLATLYDLTRALEFYWTEPFQNPILKVDGGIVTLPRFADDFTELEDLYAITDAFDAEKYLNTLGFALTGQSAGGWDSTLRALRESIPAQNQTVILSLREDVLGLVVPEHAFWDPDTNQPGDQLMEIHDNGFILPGMEEAYAYYELQQIQRFRNTIQEGRRDAFEFAFGTGRDAQDFLAGFELVVSTSEKSNYFFDAREWNARIETIQVDIRTEGGFIPPGQEENFVRVNMIQEGSIKFRRSFPLELAAAQFDTYQTEFRYRSDRLRISPFEFPVQAGINGSTGPFGGQPAVLPYFFSPFCTAWRIVIDPMASPANNYADINKIKDIRIILTLRSGIPPTIAEGL